LRAPSDRMVVVRGVGAFVVVVRRFVDRRENLHPGVTRAVVGAATAHRGVVRGLIVVPLVRPGPAGGQALRGGLVAVGDVHRRGRRPGRVVAEVATDQFAV